MRQLDLRRFFRSRPVVFSGLALWAFAVLSLAPLSASAGPLPELVGVLHLAAENEVAKSLELTDEQRTKLQELFDQREDKGTELLLDAKDLPVAERDAKLAPFRQDSEKLGKAILNPKQWGRLDQIRIGRTGLTTLAEPQIAEKLKLTSTQRSEIKDLIEERAAALKSADSVSEPEVRANFERQLKAVLDRVQFPQWEAMAGQTAGEALPEAATKTEPVKTDPTKTGPAGTSPPATKSEPGKSEVPVRTAPRGPRPAGPVSLKFNFRYQPWKDVLDWFADQADLSLFMEAPPQGTFNYTDDKSYTPGQALDLLNGALLTKGFTLIRRERMLMLVNLEDGIPPNLVPYVPVEQIDEKGEFELISVLFKLDKMTPAEAEAEIKKLLGPQGSVVVLPKARQILVTETAGRLKVIRPVIQAIENPEDSGQLQVFPLTNASLEEVLPVVRQMLDIPADRTATTDGSIRLGLDPVGNKLFASGKPEKIARLKEILKEIDIEGTKATPSGIVESPQLEVYTITTADPDSVLKVMQTLLAGLPDVRLAIDPKTGNLVALARPSQHSTIKATLGQMQRDARQVEVIRLKNLDPQLAVLSINKLFNEGDKAGANAPKVDADTTNNTLLVRGSEAQVAQIRDLLTKMGESGGGSSVEEAEKSKVRTYALSGRQATKAIEQLQAVWPTVRQNKIRVVTPSAIMPELRGERTPSGAATPATEPAGLPASVLEQLLQSGPARRLGPAAPLPPAKTEPKTGPSAPATNPQPEEPRDRRYDERRFEDRRDEGPRRDPPRRDEKTTSTPTRAIFARQIVEEKAEASAPVEPAPVKTPLTQLPGVAVPPTKAAPAPAAQVKPEPKKPVVDPVTGEPAPIIVTILGSRGIMVACEDTEVLDQFEGLLRTLTTSMAGGREYTIFYLKSASVGVVAETLEQIFAGGGASSGDSGGGGLIGDLAGAALGNMGGGLFGSLLGLGGGGSGGGSALSASGITIVPDVRLNALIVQASPADLDTMEELLKVLDQPDAPETDIASKPKLIPVKYTSAATIAELVREVYRDRLTNAAGAGGQRQPSPEEFIQMLRGGRGGGGGARGGNSRNAQAQVQKMSLGVDTRTNSLIVSAPQALLEEVEQLVATLDNASTQTDDTMSVVTLKRSNPQAVAQALSAILGETVRTTPATRPNTPGTRPGVPGQPGFNQQPGNQPSQAAIDEQAARMQIFRALQGQGGGGGLFGGGQGGRGAGGFGGGSSGFGGGGRGPTGGSGRGGR